MIIIFICPVLLIGNYYRTDNWTGDKPFSEFVQRDWHLLFVFLLEEFSIIAVMFLFGFLASRINQKRDKEIESRFENDKYIGIESGNYDYVWFDFANTQRALILKRQDNYFLYVQEYDFHTENWENIGRTSIYDSLEAIKEALLYEYDFYCEENAESDKHGDEIYRSDHGGSL